MIKRDLLTDFTQCSEQTQDMAFNAIYDTITEIREELKSDEREEAVTAEQSA